MSDYLTRILVVLIACPLPACAASSTPLRVTRSPAPELAVITERGFQAIAVTRWTIVGTSRAGDLWDVTVEAEVHNDSSKKQAPVCYVSFDQVPDLIYPAEVLPPLDPGDWVNLRGHAYFEKRPSRDSDGVYCRPLANGEFVPDR